MPAFYPPPPPNLPSTHRTMTDLFGPGSLDEVRVEHLVPAVLALNVCAVLKVARHSLPVMQTLRFHYLPQFFVLNHSTYVTHNSLPKQLQSQMQGQKDTLHKNRDVMLKYYYQKLGHKTSTCTCNTNSSLTHTHTHTHMYAHPCTHMHTQTRAHAHTHARNSWTSLSAYRHISVFTSDLKT